MHIYIHACNNIHVNIASSNRLGPSKYDARPIAPIPVSDPLGDDESVYVISDAGSTGELSTSRDGGVYPYSMAQHLQYSRQSFLSRSVALLRNPQSRKVWRYGLGLTMR